MKFKKKKKKISVAQEKKTVPEIHFKNVILVLYFLLKWIGVTLMNGHVLVKNVWKWNRVEKSNIAMVNMAKTSKPANLLDRCYLIVYIEYERREKKKTVHSFLSTWQNQTIFDVHVL